MKNGYRKFMILWLGELISCIGSGLTSFGLGVYVFNLTGSAANMALVTLCGFLPGLLLSVFAGMLADRFDRRLLMILGDGLSGLGILLILIMMMLGKCELWHIYLGVTVSSIFSSLMQPAFSATITDLVGKEEFTKASGMMSIAGSAKFLVSPVLAGILLSAFNIQLLLILDIATFILTVLVTLVVRRGIRPVYEENKEGIREFFRGGFRAVCEDKGILVLVIVASLINLFMGCIQVLSESLVLGFSDSKTLGICESICASGMLVSSIVVGLLGVKKHQVWTLVLALAFAGIGMAGFGLWDNVIVICIFGFLFFACLPFANSSLDYLVRSNIDNSVQGRAWGVIGILSQLGSVVAFALSGVLADGISKGADIGVGRASGYIISVSGGLMAVLAFILLAFRSVHELEARAQAVSMEDKA